MKDQTKSLKNLLTITSCVACLYTYTQNLGNDVLKMHMEKALVTGDDACVPVGTAHHSQGVFTRLGPQRPLQGPHRITLRAKQIICHRADLGLRPITPHNSVITQVETGLNSSFVQCGKKDPLSS